MFVVPSNITRNLLQWDVLNSVFSLTALWKFPIYHGKYTLLPINVSSMIQKNTGIITALHIVSNFLLLVNKIISLWTCVCYFAFRLAPYYSIYDFTCFSLWSYNNKARFLEPYQINNSDWSKTQKTHWIMSADGMLLKLVPKLY